ncbi:MAG: carboxypeptidase-like regulatory domain-containing protein, partial [Acidobacteria bacterium]|nr:carboxypeptidase-like regulatory domain-containing protein [Acidobacteriota bacterium]
MEENKPPIKGGSSVTTDPPQPIVHSETKTVKPLIRPPVPRNRGYLSLSAVAGAKVTITLIERVKGRPDSKPYIGMVSEDGTLTRANITPGNYLVEIEHDDFLRYRENVVIRAGAVTPINAYLKLTPLYGEIEIVSDPKDVSILLNGQKWAADNVRVDEQGNKTFLKVPVGTYALKVSKEGYDDGIDDLKVDPGKRTPVAVKLGLSTVALTIKSLANAQVYLNNIERGKVQPDGILIIPGLLPGAHNLRISLEGFETVDKTLQLTLADRQPVETIELEPVAESSEVSENFTTGITKWIVPAKWRLDQRGLHISGEQPGLFKGTVEKRSHNSYGDFDLDFDVRFINGRGAAWIVRAKDTANYYLFELTTSNSAAKRLFNFYLCRNGQCNLKDSQNVIEALEKPDDSFHIRLEARGARFTHKVRVLSNPRKDDPQPLGTFEDT